MRLAVLVLASTVLIAGCSQQQGSQNTPGSSSVGQGILGSLRPKADPAVVQRMHQEQQQADAAKQRALDLASQTENQSSIDASSRILPRVSTDPIAPPAEEVADANGPIFSPAAATAVVPDGSANTGVQQGQPAMMVASYNNVPPPPPGSMGGGLVPPPPAVTLSTQAQVGMPAGMPADPNNLYNNPYMNPYAIPYPYQQQPYQQMPMQPAVPPHPNGSPFAAGGRAPSEADQAAEEKSKKNANFVPITPTGMESRSAYKQRDDLKALWNGVLKSNSMSLLMKDEKFAAELAHVDVGLPGESTKGSFAISQRQIDSIFKNASLDKRIVQPVRKLQADMVQAYYRYLYSYNKFALAQQTVTARKQEVEVAGSASEQQRAAADLSQSSNEAESAKDDMKSAQNELALMAGPQATRYIIGKVSGVTPNADSLAQVEETPSQQKSGGGGALGMFASPLSIFGFGGHKNEAAKTGDNADDKGAAAAPAAKVAKGDKEKPVKEKAGGKDKKKVATKAPSAAGEKSADLSPAPQAVAETAKEQASAAGQDISFELKTVNVTARKSILSVSIKNSGANNFSFSPDVFSISDGNHKLSEAAVRADFDQTLIQPNQEVKGTITIFGRPWNDRLVVVLSDGGKSIQMRR